MSNKVPIVPPLSKEQIETHAAALIKQFDPTGFSGNYSVDIERIFEFDLKTLPGLKELKTGYRDLSQMGHRVFGYTDAWLKVSFIHAELVDSTDQVTQRVFRATVAHESAHCIQHVGVLNLFSSVLADGATLFRAERKDIPAYLDPEWQAWALAGALLMPRHRLLSLYHEGASEYEMATVFDVNPAFIKRRMKALKLSQK